MWWPVGVGVCVCVGVGVVVISAWGKLSPRYIVHPARVVCLSVRKKRGMDFPHELLVIHMGTILLYHVIEESSVRTRRDCWSHQCWSPSSPSSWSPSSPSSPAPPSHHQTVFLTKLLWWNAPMGSPPTPVVTLCVWGVQARFVGEGRVTELTYKFCVLSWLREWQKYTPVHQYT